MSSLLRTRLIEDLKIRNYSPRTVKTYVRSVASFANHFRRSPEVLTQEHVREYQRYLVEEKKASWAAFNQTVCALRFLYRQTLKVDWPVTQIAYARPATRLPEVLSFSEVSRLFSCVRGRVHQTTLQTMYGAGLRLTEALNLKPRDIDSDRMVIRVHQGKGRKDRYVTLSCTLLETLRAYYRDCRPKGEWLFPNRTGQYPIHATAVLRVCRQAALVAGFRKRVTTHTLRLAWKDYATANRKRTMTLDPHEFLRRFLLHVLPSGFTRIRHYGFLANRNRTENIRLARRLTQDKATSVIQHDTLDETPQPTDTNNTLADLDTHTEHEICPECKQGRLLLILRVGYPSKGQTWSFDSS